MANPAPTINQINAFNATQGTIIDFNIIGGTELVRSNKIYIYDLSDNSLICTHLYTSTESIHELPPNTDGSIVYESGKSSADFVNGKQYYAQIQTFTNIAGTQGGSGLSVSKLFWCLVDPSLTISTIPSSISTTSYNVSATYNANTSVVSNIIQQYQFSLYSATGSLLQSSGVVVGNGEQQGTSTIYDLSYNFSGLEVGSSYYVVVEVTTTQGMSLSAQSGTFTVSIDTPTLGEATVVNNACDGYISVTSNLSSEYGGSASGEIATFETDSVNNVTKLEVELDPIQLGEGTPSPLNVRPIVGHSDVEAKIAGKNLYNPAIQTILQPGTVLNGDTFTMPWADGSLRITGKYTQIFPAGSYTIRAFGSPLSDIICGVYRASDNATYTSQSMANRMSITVPYPFYIAFYGRYNAPNTGIFKVQVEEGLTATDYEPYQSPVEVTQSFNVTLTPTVIDETPYLFKKTGDVRGDRESLELVGGTVAWNQLVKNGNFANTNNWSGQYCSISASGNVLTAEATAENVAGRIEQAVTLIAGHKYLFKENIKVSANATSRFAYRYSGGIKYTASLNATANTWGELATVFSADTQGDSGMLYLYYSNSTALAVGGTAQYKNVMLIDLTQMFGSTIANAIYALEQSQTGAGVAWFKKLFPKPYYAYNAGELMSVNTSAHNTVGFNAFDGIWENGTINSSTGAEESGNYNRSTNYIPVIPNTVYYGGNGNGTFGLRFYDADKGYITNGSVVNGNATFTTPSNAHFLRLVKSTSVNDDICINLSWDGERDGEYEEYVKHSYPLDDSLTLRGIPKLDANNNLYYDGDEYESDGAVTRKYGIVDFGTLTWQKGNSGTEGRYRFSSESLRSVIKHTDNVERGNYVISNGLDLCGANVAWLNYDSIYSIDTRGDVSVYWTKYASATAAEFKTAMSGVYLVYELATPTTETADAFEEIQKVTPNYGTEEFVDNRTVPMPVYCNTQYLTRDVYGGYIDFVNGLLVVDRAMVDLGTLNWAYDNTSYAYSFFTSTAIGTRKGGSLGDALCSQYTVNQGGRYSLGSGTGQIASYNEGATTTSVCVRDDNYTDATAFKTAMNGVQLVCELAEPMIFQLTPQQIQTLIGQNNVWSDAGEVEVAYNIPITNLLVKRQDVADVSGDWLTLHSQPITQASDMDFTFIDFTNQYGKTYKYALVPLLTQTQSGVEVEVEGGYTVSDEVQSIFDGVYIGDSTGVQRLKAGVAYNNLNTNQQVGVIPTLGNKYPIIVSNSNIQYDTGSVSGLIVPDDFYSNGNLSRLDMSDKRVAINDFLTNKKPKILKDWNGNIWLVVFTDNVDVSFDNNYGMGIATFTSGWTEVGDPTNQEDLQRTGLINVGGD